MSGVTAVELIIEARGILNNLAFHEDREVIRACDTVVRLIEGAEASNALQLRSDLELQAENDLGFDLIRLQAAVELLGQVTPEAQLLHLKNLCVNNGVWTVPEDPSIYSPVWYEVSLFGVAAMAEEAGLLPVNWCIAARRVLNAYSCGGAS